MSNDFNDDFLEAMNAPDLDLHIGAAETGEFLCRCSGEYLPREKAFRLGCDQFGGCPELREAMEL